MYCHGDLHVLICPGARAGHACELWCIDVPMYGAYKLLLHQENAAEANRTKWDGMVDEIGEIHRMVEPPFLGHWTFLVKISTKIEVRVSCHLAASPMRCLRPSTTLTFTLLPVLGWVGLGFWQREKFPHYR
jgi:hypothetical protein